MGVRIPKRVPEISSATKSGDISIWIKKIKDESNIDMLYRYITEDFGKSAAYMSLIKGELHYKHNKEEDWYKWVDEYDLGTDEDDGPEIKQLISEYIHKLVEKELLS
ncbi:hypothetical protein UFOVP53_172 [uncultured Caudovirales phage]|uniref:Uncharacterized protein n=1 Tax=uncultured Caudovirales phage TaxID=2100421 RepID=A0A6J5KSX4_9CAUD|nr:hypothetical protein UFOVP53_172 [uncultured Caudovirales phage]